MQGTGEMIKKKYVFLVRHFDFVLVDLLAFIFGYSVSMLIRESLNIAVNNQDLFLAYGATAFFSFLVVEIVSENLNGIVFRGLIREMQAVFSEVTLTWTVFLSLLFFEHIIFGISRTFIILSYVLCGFFLLVFRNIWKYLCKYTKLSRKNLPKLIVVCESSRAQTVLERLLPGALNNEYVISGIVMNGKDEPDYHDWYPAETGLEKIGVLIQDRMVQDAYVELDDPKDEKQAIECLLKAGTVVHRSLGDSHLDYAWQSIDELNRKTVITISEARTSFVSRAEGVWQKIRRRIHREK